MQVCLQSPRHGSNFNVHQQKKCVKKMWYLHAVDHYSATKKNEGRPFAAPWIDLEIVLPSDVRQRKTNVI